MVAMGEPSVNDGADGSASIVLSSGRQLAPAQEGPGGRGRLLDALQAYNASQRQLSLASSRASSAALMLGLANRADNARLDEQQKMLGMRLSLGERVLGELKGQVDGQTEEIRAVETKVAQQDTSIETLQTQVHEQRANLERLAQEYKQELEAQRKMIQESRSAFGKLMLSKLKQDFTLDAVILLAAWIMAQTPVVGFPLGLLSTLTGAIPLSKGGARSRTATVSKFGRLLVVAFFARSLRIVAARNGLHNNVGGPEAYLTQAVEIMSEKAQGLGPLPLLQSYNKASTTQTTENNTIESNGQRPPAQTEQGKIGDGGK